MSIEVEKIVNFLRTPGIEGTPSLTGYIPCNLSTGGTANFRGAGNIKKYIPMGISGVTIATGVDLGQTDEATLVKLGIRPGLVRKLSPYLGKRQRDAVIALAQSPLKITQADADELDYYMIRHHICLAARRYDKDSPQHQFADLPWQAQAAITSIIYQRGTGSPSKYPNTWRALLRADWQDASARLKTGTMWSGYQSRRAMEGDLLAQLF